MEKEIERLRVMVISANSQVSAMRLFLRLLIASENARNPQLLPWLQSMANGEVPEPHESDIMNLPAGMTDEQKAELEEGLALGRKKIREATMELAGDFARAIEMSRRA